MNIFLAMIPDNIIFSFNLDYLNLFFSGEVKDYAPQSLLNKKPEMKVKAKKVFELKSKKSISTNYVMQIRHGLGVRIAGSHPAGPGSIPGVGTKFYPFLHYFKVFIFYVFSSPKDLPILCAMLAILTLIRIQLTKRNASPKAFFEIKILKEL